jgi:hypothetical protein
LNPNETDGFRRSIRWFGVPGRWITYFTTRHTAVNNPLAESLAGGPFRK